MKNIHIEDSYRVWSTLNMRVLIRVEAVKRYKTANAELMLSRTYPELLLNRTYRSMFIEWWLHNIGYYLTKPFCFFEKIDKLNKRFKHVDLEEWTDG